VVTLENLLAPSWGRQRLFSSDDGVESFVQGPLKFLTKYTSSHPRRQLSFIASHPPSPLEPQILTSFTVFQFQQLATSSLNWNVQSNALSSFKLICVVNNLLVMLTSYTNQDLRHQSSHCRARTHTVSQTWPVVVGSLPHHQKVTRVRFHNATATKIVVFGRDCTFRDILDQSFSTLFNSRHTEQGAKIVKAHHQFF
jgi:hypothetical protein